MFSSLKVLLVGDCTELTRVTSGMSFGVIECHNANTALDHFDEADILVLNMSTNGGFTADLVLDRWIEDKGYPSCILIEIPSHDVIHTMRVRGVWDTIPWPNDTSDIQSVLRRYAHVMLDRNRLASLETRLKKLTYSVYALGLLVVGIGGVEVIPKVLGLLV